MTTPCSQPNPCEDGELCGTHEVEQAHAEGEHEFCGVTCEIQFPSDMIRNGILAKGYPGTAGMLDELLRRAIVEGMEVARLRAEQAEAAIERARKLATSWAVLRAYGSAATELLAALNEPKEPTP